MSEVPLSPSECSYVDEVGERFDAAWREGGRPRLEEFLAGAAGSVRTALLRQLLKVELYYRRLAGESHSAEDYRQHLPGNAETVAAVFAEATPSAANVTAPSGPAADGKPANGPFRAEFPAPDPFPGLWPGLTETAFQAEGSANTCWREDSWCSASRPTAASTASATHSKLPI
jgi:hypothetical protein